MSTISSKEFSLKLDKTIKALHKARKRRVKLSSYSFYSEKVRSALANVRKSFLALQRDYPQERYPRVAFQLASIEPLLDRIFKTYPTDAIELLHLADEIKFKAQSDLAVEIENAETALALSSGAPFIPNDLIEDRHYILKRVLWEINRSYDAACYNSCAAMVRRLTESLIVEAFEHHKIADKIKRDENYVEFSALIGMAIAEPKLGLTRNTKRVLPELKFFGDLGAHNRKALVRKDDLDRFHQAIRSAVEELANNI
ncbi:MAG: hypothetical protein FJ025_05490 [Chloroflexi bacterium]|nr:hypothetical protein [Chloroflexota bacterium]